VKVVLFYHSALSDWNHGNAHFLRGIAAELQARGHDVVIREPASSWSAANLVADHGMRALLATMRAYPTLVVERYDERQDLDAALDGADLVIVHEWNTHELVARIGRHRASGGRYRLLFHDTHHRSVSDAAAMAAYDLSGYDGVLAYGEVIRERYLRQGWARRVWTWHEAADVRVFRPRHGVPSRDLVWIGNWGDDERTKEIAAFLIEPVRTLGLPATVYGVRYPPAAIEALGEAGVVYRGWLPNYRVPNAFARHRVTVHIPRRPYVEALPGIPTIRPFEALACGIPLISAPWEDVERLFRAGRDYLVARTGAEMTARLRDVLNDRELAASLARHGRATILARHTCAHRVDELFAILAELRTPAAVPSEGEIAV